MKAELVPTNGDQAIPIRRDLTVIGRRDYCDIQINHHGVSKRHCVVVKTEGLLVIRDLATTNGTKVNGQRIRWAALLPNDRVTIGGYKMKVYLGPDATPSPSEQAAGSGRSTTTPAAERPVGDVSESTPVSVPLAEAEGLKSNDPTADDLRDLAWVEAASKKSSAPLVIDLDD